MPTEVIWTTTRWSLWVCPGGHPHVLYSFFPSDKHFTCFTDFHLCGNSLLQSRRARALSPASGLVARIQHSHHCDPTSVSGQELKPCFKLLQAETTWDHIWCWNLGSQGEPWTLPSCSSRPLTFTFVFFLLLSALLSFQDPQGITSVCLQPYGSP